MKFEPNINDIPPEKISIKELREMVQLSEEVKIIFEIEDWILEMQEEMTSETWSSQVYIGRNFHNRRELIIGGTLVSERKVEKVKIFFEERMPPVQPIYRLESIKLSKIKKKERRKIKIDIESHKK